MRNLLVFVFYERRLALLLNVTALSVTVCSRTCGQCGTFARGAKSRKASVTDERIYTRLTLSELRELRTVTRSRTLERNNIYIANLSRLLLHQILLYHWSTTRSRFKSPQLTGSASLFICPWQAYTFGFSTTTSPLASSYNRPVTKGGSVGSYEPLTHHAITLVRFSYTEWHKKSKPLSTIIIKSY